MTVVLLDQEMDRAEAFRLSKRIRLPPEVVLSSNGSLPRAFAFYRILGLDAQPVVRRLMAMWLDVGMSETLGSVDVPYADRLSHLVDLDDPVAFHDIRDLPPEEYRNTNHPCPTVAPVRDSGTDGPSGAAAQDLAGRGSNAVDGGPRADAGSDGGRTSQSDATGVGLREAVL